MVAESLRTTYLGRKKVMIEDASGGIDGRHPRIWHRLAA